MNIEHITGPVTRNRGIITKIKDLDKISFSIKAHKFTGGESFLLKEIDVKKLSENMPIIVDSADVQGEKLNGHTTLRVYDENFNLLVDNYSGRYYSVNIDNTFG